MHIVIIVTNPYSAIADKGNERLFFGLFPVEAVSFNDIFLRDFEKFYL